MSYQLLITIQLAFFLDFTVARQKMDCCFLVYSYLELNQASNFHLLLCFLRHHQLNFQSKILECTNYCHVLRIIIKRLDQLVSWELFLVYHLSINGCLLVQPLNYHLDCDSSAYHYCYCCLTGSFSTKIQKLQLGQVHF